MKSLYYLLILSFIIALFGCSGISVVYDYDVEADFGSYNSFRWAANNAEKNVFDNPLMDKRLKNAVTKHLENKGYQKAEENADLILSYEQSSRPREDIYVTSYSHGWRWQGAGFGVSRISRERYLEGMIILRIYDAHTAELIWQGWATGIEVMVENIEEIMNETARKLVEKFPPPQKKK